MLTLTVLAAAVTVSTVEPTTPPSVAEIADVPVPTPVASPTVLMVATVWVAEPHVTWLVMFCVELSENVPVAVNCWLVPLTMLGLGGVTEIVCKAAALTVRMVEPLTPLNVALMVDEPLATPVARPAGEIAATVVVAEAHVTWLVRFCVELSLNVPVAVN